MLALWGVPTWSEDLAGRIRPKTHLRRLGRSRGNVLPPSSEDLKGWNPCAGARPPEGDRAERTLRCALPARSEDHAAIPRPRRGAGLFRQRRAADILWRGPKDRQCPRGDVSL
jgi:hypothetical protein